MEKSRKNRRVRPGYVLAVALNLGVTAVVGYLAAGDGGAAADAQKRFETCAKRYPYPSDIAGERELMGLVGEKW